MELFNQSVSVLERALDLRTVNQRVIASNLANIDTPGYTAQQLDFDASMQRAMGDLEATATPIVDDSADPTRSLDGNNVDLEGELSRMSRNKIMYNLSAQLLGAKFRQLNTIFEQEQG